VNRSSGNLATTLDALTHEVPVTFVNRRGLRLVGILETPANRPSHDLAVVLLSPGVKMRLGPQGLYRRMSAEFLRLGVPVLRFDFHGLGDSEGVLTEDLLRDFYNHIEVGRYVDDTIDAMDWMQAQHGSRRFVLSGLCGGAITGLLAGARDNRVAGLLALGITPTLASRAADQARYMSSGQLDRLQQSYVQKLLKPSAWLRLLTFKSDYRVLWRILKRLVSPGASTASPHVEAAAPDPQDNSNPLFPPAFFQMLATKRPMLLVFGGSDRLAWEFEEKFVSRYRDRLAQPANGYELHIVEHANHVFSFAEWQREMLEHSRRWFCRHFPDAVDASRAMEQAALPATGRSAAGTARSRLQGVET
jgi:pimeloyl-ACP methyl ester carboxylesterase